MKDIKYIIIVLLLIVISVVTLYGYNRKEGMSNNNNNEINLPMIAKVISLEKNKVRLIDFMKNYYNSDMKDLKITVFKAIVGKDINPKEYLPQKTLDELAKVEKDGHRTSHYQLTRGGIGCFLSHLELAKQLLNDPDYDRYFICEDDVRFLPEAYKIALHSIKYAPSDWHMLSFGHIRCNCIKKNEYFQKPMGFWGTQGYILNKKGAKCIIDEVNKTKIDGQIDAYLSVMSQENKLNIYLYNDIVIENDRKHGTDIQNDIIEGPNSFVYKGYIV